MEESMNSEPTTAQSEEQIAEEQLSEVAGGKKESIQAQRLEQLDTHDSSKGISKGHERLLEQLDNPELAQ
ncbi:MAG: hypothetical protein AAGF01_33140 [Cyanobacteria bacterium P01_G01_bin.38]